MRTLQIGLVAASLLALAACDYSGDWLFAGAVEGVPGIVHLGAMEPADIVELGDIDDNAFYGEVGPTGTVEKGGVTFTFEGTGSHVCVWADPELLFWNQSVATQRPAFKWTWPDNVMDDGDLDLYAGLAAYYNGTPGEEIGDFKVRYTDSLDNEVTIALNECVIPYLNGNSGGHAGRGAPEYCTISNTQPGVNYLVLMQTWSTPLDDDRLGYGLLLSNGDCDDLIEIASARNDECVILGEAVDPNAPGETRAWYGADAVPSWSGSVDFEQAYCSPGTKMSDYCTAEWATKDCDVDHCFCGDPKNTPAGGSF